MKTDCLPDSFQFAGSSHTLALLVEAKQKLEIGLRIKELRDNSAETSRTIADYCNVSVEAVRNWIAGKGIAYDNAVKVAELFKIDVDELWRGPRQETDLLSRLSALEAGQHQILRELAAIREFASERVATEVDEAQAEAQRRASEQPSGSARKARPA